MFRLKMKIYLICILEFIKIFSLNVQKKKKNYFFNFFSVYEKNYKFLRASVYRNQLNGREFVI